MYCYGFQSNGIKKIGTRRKTFVFFPIPMSERFFVCYLTLPTFIRYSAI